MRHLRLLFVAFALTLSSAVFANPTSDFEDKGGSISAEIEKMLKDSNLVIEEEFTVTVFFIVTEERKIEIRSIASPNEEVNEFLKKRLQNQKVHGKNWFTNKIYELPVKVEARR